jgi:hypothetical protein
MRPLRKSVLDKFPLRSSFALDSTAKFKTEAEAWISEREVRKSPSSRKSEMSEVATDITESALFNNGGTTVKVMLIFAVAPMVSCARTPTGSPYSPLLWPTGSVEDKFCKVENSRRLAGSPPAVM